MSHLSKHFTSKELSKMVRTLAALERMRMSSGRGDECCRTNIVEAESEEATRKHFRKWQLITASKHNANMTTMNTIRARARRPEGFECPQRHICRTTKLLLEFARNVTTRFLIVRRNEPKHSKCKTMRANGESQKVLRNEPVI